MKKIFYLMMTAALVFTTACSDNDDHNKGAVRIPDKGQLAQTFAADQLTGSINIQTDAAWTATVTETTRADAPAWLTVTPLSGNAGSQKVTFTMSVNGSGAERSAQIVFTCDGDKQTVNIKQTARNLDGSEPETPGVPSEGTKLVKKITATFTYSSDSDDDDKEIYNFQYDATKRVNKVTYSYTDGPRTATGETTIGYSGNEIQAIDTYRWPVNVRSEMPSKSRKKSNSSRLGTRAVGDDLYIITTDYKLDANGYVVSSEIDIVNIEEGQPVGDPWEQIETTTTYTDGYIKSTTWRELGYESIYTSNAVWTGGNLTKVSDKYESYTITYGSVENSDKVNFDLNWLLYHGEAIEELGDFMGMLDLLGLYGKRSANMVSSIVDEDGDKISFNYQTNSDGLINKVTATYEYDGELEGTEVFEIEYQ